MTSTASLFLLSACLAGAIASEMLQKRINRLSRSSTGGSSNISIKGPNMVTIGISYNFYCSATKSFCDGMKDCAFTMTVEGTTHNSWEFTTKFTTYAPTTIVTCEVTSHSTGITKTARKIVQVAEGPSNLTMKAPKMLFHEVGSTFECLAICRPSCNYTWSDEFGHTLSTSGSVLNYKAPISKTKYTVFCKAQNSLSRLYKVVRATVKVADGPNTVTIQSGVENNQVTYLCTAQCLPQCSYTWHYQGKVYHGDQLTLKEGEVIFEEGKPIRVNTNIIYLDEFHKTEQLDCTALNPLSGKSANATKILNVNDPIGVLPVTSSPIVGSSYTLRCAGATQNSQIQWTKDGKPLAANDRVHLGDNDHTLTFEPLQQSDSGTYDCSANEQGNIIQGVSYDLNVIYGPLNAKMTVWYKSEERQVGQTTLLDPGSSATFSCSAQCYPACQYAWLFNDVTKSRNSPQFTISSASAANEGSLVCVPYNTITGQNTLITTTIKLTGGPTTVTISGPKSVQVGQKSTFECSAVCSPQCTYSWEAYGRTVHGSKMELTISHYIATETVTCIAQNPITNKIATTNTTVDVTDPDWCGC